RYGVVRDWVMALEAVLPTGEVIKTGSKTSKGVVGFDLTRLLVGSEGALAVITKATLKLAPRPESRHLMRALFNSIDQAANAVMHLMGEGEPPTAIELIDSHALQLLREHAGLSINEAGEALLLLEVSGNASILREQSRAIESRLKKFNPLEVMTAQSEAEAEQVWQARFALSPTLKKLAPKRINEDVAVPVSRLAELIRGLEEISKESALPMANFGHAGNGNIHVNLLVDPQDKAVMQRVESALEKVFKLTLSLDGTLSGEHGVGIQKCRFVPWELNDDTLNLHRRIKHAFDPKGVLNPGKAFP
ncbi:FAD-binding oxidoreductase, partial [Magnetococcales bacterium HHB-1]